MATGFLYDLRTGAALAAVQSPTDEGFATFATPGFGLIRSEEPLEDVWVSECDVLPREALALDGTDYSVELGQSLALQFPADCHVMHETSLLVSEQGAVTITPNETGTMRLRVVGRYRAPDIIVAVVSLADAKSALLSKANEQKQVVIDAGVSFAGHVWDADTDAQDAIKNAAGSARLGLLPDGYYWTSKANENVPIDNDGVVALAQRIIAFAFEVHAHNQELKKAIEAAATLEDLNSIDVQANWPS